MTSGNFALVPVQSIFIDRENRQRRELEGIEELAESIRVNGLINPIVITREHVLVAGERRLTAHQHLGFDTIAVQYAEDLTEIQLHLIELEENIRRIDLSWQDHVNAVARFHSLKEQQAEESGETWSQEKTADELGSSRSVVARQLLVKKIMDEGVKEVVEAPQFSVAANFAQRMQERKKTAALRDLAIETKAPTALPPAESGRIEHNGEELAPIQPRYAEILNTNFMTWAEQVQQHPYNLIHCDFPYGINAGDTKGQSGAKSFGGYADTADIYFELLGTLIKYQDRFISPSAHMIFWFSMKYYQQTVEMLREAGWRVDDFPLIWHRSDNSGILPDAQRGPRRTYETALFCSRGDRKVVKAVANSIGAVTTKEFHMSEKPTPVLEHFFRMVVDESTLLLDPTCGSGNAVKVAEAMGANWATGLELNPEFADRAKENLKLEE